VRLALALAVFALLTTGCIDSVQKQLEKIRGKPEAPPDFSQTWSDAVDPNHAKTYAVPVKEQASLLTVSATLSFVSSAPAQPPLVPARVTLGLRDPSGASVGETKTLDAQAPSATLTLSKFPSFGTYNVVLTGNGLSGNGQGARYNLTARVAYANPG
jgi:hypothetical protein